jgi:alpha-amylase/alpha-mannosidase (GH57 family)
MEFKAPDTYQAVLEADKISRETFSGHGSAMAQCYSHMIMPLADSKDKYTQVYWGIRDFEFRFKRLPEGMWLPETAVDLETLQIMADLGIRFTVLAPHQAGRLLDHGELDINQPYSVRLGAGRSINVFFYNGALSQSLAFENILQDGKCFAEKLMQTDNTDGPQLLSVATDGETYGHHHKFGDMALAFALKYIDDQVDARLTNFAEYLEKFPPQEEIEIIEKTSWSCAHGVGRWSSNCGCETGGRPEWNQGWRGPLRKALDWFQCRADSIFVEVGKGLFKDPWEARNRYIDIRINRYDRDTFLAEQCQNSLDESKKVVVLKLLELQSNAMLMYTSCGWFFNDISGIETEQILLYAGKAIQLAEEISGEVLEPHFLELLELAESNVLEKGNGSQIYKNVIEKARMDFQV